MRKRRQPRRNEIAALCLSLAFLLIAGCTLEGPAAGQAADFASEVQSLNALYAEAGLSLEEIQRIDSAGLLSSADSASLAGKLSALLQKLAQSGARIGGLAESGEKQALLALVQIDTVRANYLKALAELKGEEKFAGAVAAFESFDFSAWSESQECQEMQSAARLQEGLEKTENFASALENQVAEYRQNFSEYAGQAGLGAKKPNIGQTGLQEFIHSYSLLSEGCSALADSMAALAEIEAAAGEQNLCFSLNNLGRSIASLDEIALELDSLSGKAASINALGIDAASLEQKRKALLSVSEEFKEFEKQLEAECG